MIIEVGDCCLGARDLPRHRHAQNICIHETDIRTQQVHFMIYHSDCFRNLWSNRNEISH
jgi:hypothetical protein